MKHQIEMFFHHVDNIDTNFSLKKLLILFFLASSFFPLNLFLLGIMEVLLKVQIYIIHLKVLFLLYPSDLLGSLDDEPFYHLHLSILCLEIFLLHGYYRKHATSHAILLQLDMKIF